MDACIRNLSFAHYTSLSPLERADSVDKGRYKGGLLVESHEEELVCPKPRRMAVSCCAHDPIKPLCHWQGPSRTAECDAGFEILEVFLNKDVYYDGEFLNFECSPPFCSPPTRAGNPIVHDIRFGSHKTCPPPQFGKPKLTTVPSLSSNPSVRIEGFECAME